MNTDELKKADEIVRALRGFVMDNQYPVPAKLLEAADLIDSLASQLAEATQIALDVTSKYETSVKMHKITADLLTASQRRERAAVEKSILWGADLITENTDAHVIFCAECGYPIADYGVDEDVSCAMCKAKNHSHNYAPGGPGYCRTTVDRRAKVYDKLFSSGPQEAEKGEAE